MLIDVNGFYEYDNREALLQADWASAGSWAPLAQVLEASTDRAGAATPAGRSNDEVTCARQELDDVREHFMELVRAEMKTGRSVKIAVGKWERKGLSSTKLSEALDEAEAFPRQNEPMTELIETGRVVVDLRKKLATSV